MRRFFHTRAGQIVLAIAFFGLAIGIGQLSEKAYLAITGPFDGQKVEWTPGLLGTFEALSLFDTLVATLIVAAIGGYSMRELGFGTAKLRKNIFEGSVYGLAMPTLLIVAISLLGGFSWGTLNLHGAQLAEYTLGWFGVMVVLGLFEEFVFRGAPLQLLTKALGFWPAALLMSALFVAGHAGKPNENIADLASVGLIGLFVCYTVKRTGSIWWAVAFHALFDYAALFVYGAPNSGNQGGKQLATRLLTGTYHGPAWLTGGHLGIEASWLVFPLLALAATVFAIATMTPKSFAEES